MAEVSRDGRGKHDATDDVTASFLKPKEDISTAAVVRNGGGGDADYTAATRLDDYSAQVVGLHQKLDSGATSHRKASSPIRSSSNFGDGSQSASTTSEKIDTLVPFPSNLPLQYKALVTQIENSKHPNYPFILRQVYEAGHLKNFLQYLDKRSEARDAEIERVCAAHTLTLTEAARDLMSVSKGVDELREALNSSNQSGPQVIENMKKSSANVAACNHALVNTAQLMERISLLKPVIQTVGEAHICIEKGQLVKALRKLHDSWERTRKLPHHIRLVKSLADNIPRMKALVIREATSGITSALESLRNINMRAGFLTLRNVCAADGMYMEPFAVETGKKLSMRYVDELIFINDSRWTIDTALNLAPLLVYRHLMLNFEQDDLTAENLKKYKESYMVQRRNQVVQLIQPPNHMHTVDHFRHYIQEIIGVFALERHVTSTIPGIASDNFYTDLWNETSADVATALKTNFTSITDEDGCAQLKTLMNIFAVTLHFLHCDSTRIHSVLEDVRDLYGEILLKRLVEQMNSALKADNFEPMVAKNQQDLQTVLGDFPFKSSEKPDAQFPRQMPFSSSVPVFYSLIKIYIKTYVQFSRDLKLSQSEVDEKVRKSTNTVLSRNLRGSICGEVEKGHLNPAQLVQVYANCTFLEYSCQYLEEYISEQLQSTVSTSSVKLESDSLFKDIRSQVEQQVYSSLMLSVEAMVGESQFDSGVQEATNEPSPLAVRVIRYLEAVFTSIRKMPYAVCQTAWMTACKHIANQLQEAFVHKSPIITIGGVQQLKNDLGFYEDFLHRQREYTDPSTLLLAFTDLRQLTELLLLWDWTTYFHEQGKKDAKYNRVQPQTALCILDKMKESDRKKGNVLDNFRKSEREKKKLFDTIIAQLKDLIAEAQTR